MFSEIQDLAKPITRATMELYDRVVRDLPPTPSKFHYIFNLRDLSRIYHGLFLTTMDRFNDPASLVRVWRNECLRVFYDRLTNDKDRDLISEHMSELLREYFAPHAEVINITAKPGGFQNYLVVFISTRLHSVILYCTVISELPSFQNSLESMRTFKTLMPLKHSSKRLFF